MAARAQGTIPALKPAAGRSHEDDRASGFAGQAASLEALKASITVTAMPAAELEKMKDLARKGVLGKMKNDPKQAPILKLLEQDVARFEKKA